MTTHPLLDPWSASSLLQKAIRRGDQPRAAMAAAALMQFRGSAVWPRLLTIACEDVGVAAPALVVRAARLCLGRTVRKAEGEDLELAASLARALAGSVKDRSSDLLYCTAMRHPLWARTVRQMEAMDTHEALEAAMDDQRILITRAAACVRLSGIRLRGQTPLAGDLAGLMGRFEAAGVPGELLTAVEIAARKLRHPFVVLLPLLWRAAYQLDGKVLVDSPELRPVPVFRGLPLYAWDKHTRLGRQAVRLMLKADPHLMRFVQARCEHPARAPAVALMAAFHVEAAEVDVQLAWSRSLALITTGREADLIHAGCTFFGVPPVLEALRLSLDLLDDMRVRLLTRSLQAGGAA